jgi:hypothetical protein
LAVADANLVDFQRVAGMDTLARPLRIMIVMVCCITVQREAKEPTASARTCAPLSPHLAPTGMAARGD